MSRNKIISIAFIVLCISSHAYADNRGYLKLIFKNKEAVPAIQTVAARSQQILPNIQLTFIDVNLNKVFASYTVLNFEKEYPVADNFPDDQTPAVHLRLVYKVIIDTATGKSYDGLKKSMDSVKSSLIDTTVRMFPPVSLINPNDYNLSNFPPSYEFPSVADQLNLINASGAWNITTGLSCVKIGIVEPDNNNTFQQHADFLNTNGSSKIITSSRSVNPVAAYTATSTCGNGALCYHGESVAGLAGAATNNNLGGSFIRL